MQVKFCQCHLWHESEEDHFDLDRNQDMSPDLSVNFKFFLFNINMI